jgi:thiol-disulfide isomerase/thioredoxin
MPDIINNKIKRMKILIFVLLLALQLTSLRTNGQSTALKTGDQVPEMSFPDAFNVKKHAFTPVRFADLRGKLVILDFWGTFCEPCLEEFPYLDSLQREYKDKLQIIAVNPQRLEVIREFFEVHKGVYKPSFPFINDEKDLEKIFYHQGVPFQVWIGPDGKVLHLADPYNLTRKNIDQTLKGRNTVITNTFPFVYKETLFDDQWKGFIMFSSYLARAEAKGLRLDGPGNGKGITEDGEILFLYQRAYDELTEHRYELFRPGRTLLLVKNPSTYTNVKKERDLDWEFKNIYSYQLTVPADSKANLAQLMTEDLKRYFGLDVTIEKRIVKTLILVGTSQIDKMKTKGGIPKDNFNKSQLRAIPGESVRCMINIDYRAFSERIKGFVEYGFRQAFADSTLLSGKIDFKMSGEVLDHLTLNSLKQELHKYDLDLKEGSRTIDVLVLKEPDYAEAEN